ncbi:Rne/Rng family ribonuclease [Pseudosulfitobacter pseudonitzschiae]|uniref:Rne/Rng family ribonuclease n=2 Tax=Pseudosulfitobacter pseudonitzschiae TaxID=1402135 RepID=UPI001AF16397|nr:ribonuclease E/G [Pseudosulfitobacter pseudonitzschiae]MBM1814697.1 ribonuclease E/G [Pseudosulfitobacter pseudonitzschiae]MBM1831691.1 ribonuclease E/G [Pseudosulfitobacter pseudonitzschiae]MBM1836556.1 ribonuclease E/G [Pseudosulfitobacter pseudonitzschiae]MBM1841403.1 ribonuclease E/G [Pseudosulfitobacter pseudonitzschiae]MBM1846270.1 ribonuclease E/G [Pseudosulfitobacter pseudonitzschiae]
MPKKMLIDATHAEETRVVVVDGNKVEEFDFESENKRQLAGNIYLAKVTRVEPSLQAAFVDYGGNRHGFLAFSEIHPDYYQIPVADREALMEEERALAEAQRAKDEDDDKPKRSSSRSRSRSRSSTKAEETSSDDAVTSSDEVGGMETIDLSEGDDGVDEGSSPMETVRETPVETPAADDDHDHDDEDVAADAADKDDSIESVADEDDSDDIRPVRKPRAKRYKIQEVIKVRQILLVQVVKEERGNKGAALTTYLSLAGRYCVLMPNTARGGGISRKITNAVDRKKLKEIANEIEVPRGAGLIVRTAGAKRTKAEIKRDYEYLQRMWEQIRELTLKSIAPAKIYEEGDLIKRSIRDLYNRDIDEVFVEGERGYRIAKDFMKMIMPSHAKNVKRYEDSLPLFARYQVESYLAGMFNPTVQLPSGGYIVIGVTEALVAIDVNSGRATKEGSIEQTATKTNLEAAAEVARQLRLRDLAGLIVIDFIDMDERKNNAAVEKMMKDKLKTDRARIQVGRISGFGLMEMSRQRLRPGMIEATTQPCQACHGTGLIRSDDNLALSILRQIEEEGTRRRSREVLVKCPVGISNFLMNQKREHIAQIEVRYGLSVRIEGDPTLISPDFNIEKFKTATRVVTAATQVVSVDTSIMDQIDEADARAAEAAEAADIAAEAAQEAKASQPASQSHPAAEVGEDGEPKPKRRRRRRRRRSKSSTGEDQNGENGRDDDDQNEGNDDASADTSTPETTAESAPVEDKPKPTSSRSRSTAKKAEATGDEVAADAAPEDAEETVKPKVTRTRSTRSTTAKASTSAKATTAKATTAKATTAKTNKAKATEEVAADAEAPKPKRTRTTAKAKAEAEAKAAAEAEAAVPTEVQTEAAAPVEAPAEAPVAEPVAAQAPAPEAEPAPAPKAEEPKAEDAANEDAPAKPKRKGWWSLGG